jgi:protein TonB
MTHTLSNLIAYSAQIALVVFGGAAVSLILRLDSPGFRYGYWRTLAAVCLVLPWIQPYHPPAALAATGAASAEAIASAVSSADRAQLAAASWPAIAGLVLAAGAAIRLIWIGAGLVRLHRLRRAGERAPRNDAHDRLQQILGTRAEIRYVPGLGQPVTFGVWRPVVLLPPSLRERSEDVQDAVLAHELFHVERRDWAWVLVEEAVRAAFWFHPGVWWLVSRIQLAREEVVDELTVLLTGRRRIYAEALLAYADRTPLAPAAAFARRRHLVERLVLISKEAVMSSKRVVLSCAVMALATVAGSWYAVGAFPLTAAREAPQNAPGPLERQARPITPENPIPRRVAYVAPLYPGEAAALAASGSVTLTITVDESGFVGEARSVGVSFRSKDARFGATEPDLRTKLERFAKVQLKEATPAALAVVDAFIASATQAVLSWRYDPPFQAPVSFDVRITFAPDWQTSGAPPAADGAVRVGSQIKPPTKIKHVDPIYPPIAATARVQGVIIVEVLIEADGRVGDVRILRGQPLLDQAALDAVRQWEFAPTLLNGQPVPVIMTATVNFTLQ